MKRTVLILIVAVAAIAFASCGTARHSVAGMHKVYNVKDYGAKGDGVTDDTRAIQSVLDYVVEHGGGTVYFPNGRYRLATMQEDNGVKAHLIIRAPAVEPWQRNNIMVKLEGESCVVTPCGYAQHTYPDTMKVWNNGTIVFSDIMGEKITDPAQTPSFLLSTAKTDRNIWGVISTIVRMENIGFQVKTEKGKYPYMSGINMAYVAGVYTDNVLVFASEPSMSLKSPTLDGHYSAGFVGPRVWCNPEENFTNTYVKSAFRYGFIFSEHANGNNLSAWNCDNAFVFSYMDHSAWFGRLHAQNCRNIITSLDKEFCGHKTGHSFIKIEQVGIEVNTGQEPKEHNYVNFVADPANNLKGKMSYHIVMSCVGADNSLFKAEGGADLKAEPSF